jgi:hypothetical protein
MTGNCGESTIAAARSIDQAREVEEHSAAIVCSLGPITTATGEVNPASDVVVSAPYPEGVNHGS